MFAAMVVCGLSGWNDMTKWVFVTYTVVAGVFLAVGIIKSSLDCAQDDKNVTANEVKQSVQEPIASTATRPRNDKRRKAA